MPRAIRSLAAVGHFALIVAVASAADAATGDKCGTAKRKCVAKLASLLLGCHGKAVKGGEPVDAACLAKARAKFDGGATPEKGCFAKLEAKYGAGCLTQHDHAIVASRVDAFAGDVVTALHPAYPAVVTSRCTADKLKCVAQHHAALLGCEAKAALKGTLDPRCVLKAQQKFDGTLRDPPDASKGCFAKVEAKAKACLTTGDTAPVAEQVAAAVATTDCSLDPLDPACACPTRMEFTPNATDPASRIDLGWVGFGHQQRLVSNGGIALAVSGCVFASQPCGTCALSGPVDPPGQDHRRCTGNTFVRCTSDQQCPGLGTCRYFLSPPLPVSGGGLHVCLLRYVNGPVTGSLDLDTGVGSMAMSVATRVQGGLADRPCPRCVNDVCDGGPRFMQVCQVDGTSPTVPFGDVSLDCPSGGSVLGTLTATVTSTTGIAAQTLSTDQPFCRDAGASTKRCFCDTCNSGSFPSGTVPCGANADCPDPAGPIGPICGGTRCLGGSNDGRACAAASECPSGNCTVPGAPTKPNSCTDGQCAGGICINGPLDPVCVPTGTYQPCLQDSDCAAFPGDVCAGLRQRACFGDNGTVGAGIVAAGVASPTEPTWASLSCSPPGESSGLNVAFGLPGPARIVERGSMTYADAPTRRLFATSTVHTGALGGLTGADAICQARADAAALGGTFTAWLSDALTSAASRLTHAYGDYVLVDGTVIAHGWSDLTDGTLRAPVDEDESGTPVTGSAWTNSTVYGAIDSADCAGWSTVAAGQFGQTGSTTATDATWTDGIPFEDCAQPRRLYCVEQ